MSEINSLIIPMLAYEDGVAAIEWLCKAFGFTEKAKWLDDSGKLAHGEIAMGNDIIMLASPTPDYQSPKHHRLVCADAAKWYKSPYIINGVLVYVDDIKQHFETAQKNGAAVLSEPQDTGNGMLYRAEDFEGQRWMFMQKP